MMLVWWFGEVGLVKLVRWLVWRSGFGGLVKLVWWFGGLVVLVKLVWWFGGSPPIGPRGLTYRLGRLYHGRRG